MRPVEEKDIQPLLLQIMTEFHRYCEAKGLCYFLTDGTLLGAIRHKGFIPWDNDIDVSMLDTEYDKLLNIAREDPYLDEGKRYKILLPGKLPNFHPFMKVIDTTTILYDKDISKNLATGLWLDIFRYSHDNSLEKLFDRYKKAQRYKVLNMVAVCGNVTTPKYKVAYPAICLARAVEKALGLNIETIMSKMISYEADLPHEGEYVMDVTWADKIEHHFKSQWFNDRVLVPFEDQQFYAPADYEAVLTQQFGDYMTPPPVEDQVGHPFEAYYL